jgi:hypothetical protein
LNNDGDLFTIGYNDLSGYHQLLKQTVKGRTIFGVNGAGTLTASYMFFPDPSGNFQINFKLITDSNVNSPRVGVVVDYFTARGI